MRIPLPFVVVLIGSGGPALPLKSLRRDTLAVASPRSTRTRSIGFTAKWTRDHARSWKFKTPIEGPLLN